MSILVSPVYHHVGWRVWVGVFVKARPSYLVISLFVILIGGW